MKSDTDRLDLKYKEKLLSILSSTKTLSLATLNTAREAELSLLPFYYDEQCFWVFVSQLSAHTQHLIDHPNCSVLIYDNEVSPKNSFAVERLTLNCTAVLVDENKDHVLDLMTEKLGETITLLRQLGDFYLFALHPKGGRFIAGFGQAYDVEFTSDSEAFALHHVNPAKKPN